MWYWLHLCTRVRALLFLMVSLLAWKAAMAICVWSSPKHSPHSLALDVLRNSLFTFDLQTDWMKYICFLFINVDPYLISSVIFFSFISRLIMLPLKTKMINNYYNWLVIRLSFLYRGMCILGIAIKNLTHLYLHKWYCTTNTDTYRFCFHFHVIFICNNDLCRVVISVDFVYL